MSKFTSKKLMGRRETEITRDAVRKYVCKQIFRQINMISHFVKEYRSNLEHKYWVINALKI